MEESNGADSWHQLIVIGNGFDLQCGLRSKFSDFFDKRSEEFPSLERYLGQKRQQKTDGQIVFYYPFAEQLFKEGGTIWDALLANAEDGLWRDIEGMILDFLVQEIPGTNGKTRPALIIDYYDAFLAVDGVSGVYRRKMDSECLAAIDFLNGYSHDHPEEIPNTVSQLDTILFNQLQKLERAFEDYLTEEIAKNHAYQEHACELSQSLMEKEVRDGLATETSVLDFNYTNPFVRFVHDNNIHLVNIHGNLHDYSAVFGIDGQGLMTDPNLVQFTKTYRLLSMTSPDQDKIIHTATGNNGNPTNLIKFYGHSLGDADYSYFQAIFDGVNLYSSNTRLIFYYNVWKQENGKPCDEAIAQQDMFRKVTGLMNEYGETMTNKDHGKNLMHKLLLEGRLSIKRYRQ